MHAGTLPPDTPSLAQAQPVLAAIAAGDVDALDAWLAPRGPIMPTSFLITPMGGEWATSEIISAIAQCEDNAARAALIQRMAPVLSTHVKGWADGWVTAMPRAMAGPPDLVEVFLVHGARWDAPLPDGTPAWVRLPKEAGPRATDYLRAAHAATGPWELEHLGEALFLAIDAANAPAVRALLEFGASPVAHVGPSLYRDSPRMLALSRAAKQSFARFEPIFQALWEAGALAPGVPDPAGVFEQTSAKWPCPEAGVALNTLLQQAQSRWRAQSLEQRLPASQPSRPAQRL